MRVKLKSYQWMIGIVMVILVALLLLTHFVVQQIVPGKIRQQLDSLDPRIAVSIGSINSNIVKGNISLNNVTIKIFADSDRKGPSQNVQTGSIQLSGIGVIAFLFRKELHIGTIMLDSIDIEVNQKMIEDDKLKWLSKLRPSVAPIVIRRFEFQRAFIHESADRFTMHGSLSLRNISIPQDSATKASVQDFDGNLSDIRYALPHSAHTLKIKSVVIGSKLDEWKVDSMRIIPAYPKLEFARKVGHQTDRIDAHISSIKIEKPDWKKFADSKLVAERISIGQSRVYIFRDRRMPMEKEDKPLPASYLEKIPVDTYIHELTMASSYVEYEEFPKEGDSSGTLKIEKMKIKIKPVANHSTQSMHHVEMTVDGSIMGSGSVHANVTIPLEKNIDYQVQGTFLDLSLPTLNQSAENLGGFHIESGLLNKLDFQFSMSDNEATGKIVGEYHDLVIDKLKKPSGGEKKKDWFKSFALQHLIIPRNKDKSMAESKRTGKVSFKRDPTRYFSHYMLHSLLSGVKSSFTLGFLLPG